ncbi:MAG: hypothetical protein OXH01_00575 [Bacteroidetes bacterium]|nr:hypothetical protein [Bacteroidota bacterium]
MTNPLRTSCLLFATVIGFATPGISIGQESPLLDGEELVHSCSTLSLSGGETLLIDCAPSVDLPSGSYRWTSMDTGALSYLDDLTIATPRFSAPTELLGAQQFTYHRLQKNAAGEEIARTTVQVLVHPSRVRHDCEPREGIQLDGGDIHDGCNEFDPRLDPEFMHTQSETDIGDAPYYTRELGINEQEAPDFHCPLSVTASDRSEVAITCFGQGPTNGLLRYTAEFDWPPYRQSVILEGGRFDYTIQVPDITQSADLRRLKLVALDLQTGTSTTQDVELHITNDKPDLECEDISVQEGEFVRFPCQVQAQGPLQFQIIPQTHIDGMPSGLYDHVPSFVAPDVQGDTTIVMIVRVVETSAKRLTERKLAISVFDISDQEIRSPMDFTIDCGPVSYDVYEGEDAIPISCRIVGGQEMDTFVWSWSAEGEDALRLFGLLEIISGREVIYHTPESVESDEIHTYSIVATTERDEDPISVQVKIQITVLEKPDISVTCENVLAYVGDPPIQLSCMATNDKGLGRDYTWVWEPTDRLDDPSSGTPVFDVPAEQTDLSVDYTYNVSVSAPNADSPTSPEELVVTVDRILGTLALSCTSPIIVYEGFGDLELDCMVGGLQTDADLMWDLQLISGPSDLLTANPNSMRGPIFAVPESVTEDQTYEYEIGVRTRYYRDSDPVQVTITVLKKPILSLNCENEVIVEVGDPPRRIMCEVLNDKDPDLEYTWLWNPDTRLLDADTGTPLFDVPEEQRAASENYDYEVIVSAPNADPVTASVRVTVRDPDAFPVYQLDVNPVALNFGTFGSTGVARLDPASSEIDGVSHSGPKHAGRLVLTARDSLLLNVELFKPAILRYQEENGFQGEPRSLTLYPSWSYMESCATLAAELQTAASLSIIMENGDCRQFLFGGEINLDDAERPGIYTGEILVVLSADGVGVTHAVPVSLTVERVRRVINLGPRVARFGPEIDPPASLDSDQSIRIYPLKAVLNPNQTAGTFQVSNPSIVPLEVAVTTSFGYLESQAMQGGERPVLSDIVDQPDTSRFGDLSSILKLYPSVLSLMPGESKEVRYAMEGASPSQLDKLAYTMFFDVSVAPRQYARQDQLPSLQSNNRTAIISTRIPGVYIPENNTSQPLMAALESISNMPEGGMNVTFLIETPAIPFAGQVVILGENGQNLGQTDLLVYTRSRVTAPLSAPPGEFITLEFIPDLGIPAPPSIQISVDY